MNTSKKYIIYVFVDKVGGLPYYIGKTRDWKRRYRVHKAAIKYGNSYPKYRKARKLISNGFPFTMLPIDFNLTEKESDERERFYIKFFRETLGIKLTNLTDGGEDPRFTGAEKIMGKVSGENHRLYGRHHTVETRRRISEAHKGLLFSEEHKRKLSIARRKRVIKSSTIEKMRRSMLGKNIGKYIKNYSFIGPDGEIYNTSCGFKKFSLNHHISINTLRELVNGSRREHKGWKLNDSNN